MSRPVEELKRVAAKLRPYFAAEDEAREKALRSCRQVIRYSSDAIRAVHRQDYDKAKQLLGSAHELVQGLNRNLARHEKLLHSGFIHDAQKEFAEGYITLALIAGNAAYLDGLCESVGELRRYILDSLRRDDFSRCEELLTVMDEIYGILMTMDFPELLAHGLRRTTDATRAIIERTRGDLTVSLRQKNLETKLGNLS